MITETTISRYTCTDGTAFDSKAAATEYEAEYQSVADILKRTPRNDLRHGTYVTHDVEMLRQIRRDLWPLVLAKVNAKDSFPQWLKWDADEVHPLSIVGRVLDDYGGPVAKAWSRLARFCFDTGREFDQPYFVTHPNEAKPAKETQPCA